MLRCIPVDLSPIPVYLSPLSLAGVILFANVRICVCMCVRAAMCDVILFYV